MPASFGRASSSSSSSVVCRAYTGAPGSCRYGSQCRFSHDDPAARVLTGPRPMTLCRNWNGEAGSCRYGANCNFAHDSEARPLPQRSSTGAGGYRGSSAPCTVECCVCLEVPRHDAQSGRPGRYGLMENCDHIVCMSCIMKWRTNRREDMSREARLGCPVCRCLSHIIVPWPAAVSGDERLAVITQHQERCRVTPCKWSNRGEPCPAGRHCLYDHSGARQVMRPRPRRPERRGGRHIDEHLLGFFLEMAELQETGMLEPDIGMFLGLFEDSEDEFGPLESDMFMNSLIRGHGMSFSSGPSSPEYSDTEM